MNAMLVPEQKRDAREFSPVLYDRMVHAISECFSIDEAKNIRDKAKAIEEYLRQAKNKESERMACEVRIRAERKCGEFLREMEMAKGAMGNPGGQGAKIVRSHDGSAQNEPRTLADMNISYRQSSQFQALAEIPEQQFNEILGDRGKKPTTKSMVDAGAALKQQAAPVPKVTTESLWFWGRLRELERHGCFEKNLSFFDGVMTDGMRADIKRLIPLCREWFEKLEEQTDEF